MEGQRMKNELPESPTVAYTNIKTPAGFYWSFTIRTPISVKDNNDAIAEIQRLEKAFQTASYSPQDLRSGGFRPKTQVDIVPGRVCPIDGGQLKSFVSKKDGKTYWSCMNGKFDYATKTNTGCKFFCTPESYKSKEQIQAESDGFPQEY